MKVISWQKNCWMTFLPVMRNVRGIEIGLAKHILWSLGLFLCMASQEKLIKPSVMIGVPQSVQDVQLLLFFWCWFVFWLVFFWFFFHGPVMLAACLGELSALCRYGRKVQSLEDTSQAQKAFVLLLARCKGWIWLESSSGSHTAWAEHEQVGCTWQRGVLCSLLEAASCWASQFSSGSFLLQHSCWMN